MGTVRIVQIELVEVKLSRVVGPTSSRKAIRFAHIDIDDLPGVSGTSGLLASSQTKMCKLAQ